MPFVAEPHLFQLLGKRIELFLLGLHLRLQEAVLLREETQSILDRILRESADAQRSREEREGGRQQGRIGSHR